MLIFEAQTLNSALKRVRAELGPEALVVSVESRPGGGVRVRVRAGRARRPSVEPAQPSTAQPVVRGGYAVACVGPAGAGKTTALIKLAVHASRRCDLTVDITGTGKAGETLATHDEARLLRSQSPAAPPQVTLIDTPAPAWNDGAEFDTLARELAAFAPGDVFLVLPATIDIDCALQVVERFRPVAPDALYLTHADAAPPAHIIALVRAVDLPLRFMSTDPERPDELIGRAGGDIRRFLTKEETHVDERLRAA